MKKKLVNIFVLILMFTMLTSTLFSHGAAVTDLNIKYGKATINAKLLDDFSNSQVDQSKVWRDGTVEMKDGRAYGKSSFIVDCYIISVPNANEHKDLYRSAEYIGFEIENASDGSVYYCFQGTINGADALTSPFGGKDIVLVDKDGVVQDVTFTSNPTVYERYAFMVPEGFKGYVLIPTTNVTARTDWNTSIWSNTINIDGVAFHASLGQDTTPKGDATNIEFYVDNFFVVSSELPDPNAEPNTNNPQTSDTFMLLPISVLLIAILFATKELKKRYINS